MRAHNIKGCTLKLKGVFSRLRGALYTTNLSVKAAMDINDEIDYHADSMDNSMRKLRKQKASFAKEVAKLKQNKQKLETKLKSAELELSQYSETLWDEDLFASGDTMKNITQTSSDKQKSPAEIKSVESEGKDQEKDIPE